MRGRETSVGVNGEAVDRDRWAAFELAPEGPPDPEVEYERKVGEYLARENVPLEYQEMVREYFDR